MLTETDVKEYLDEIREQVCSRCPERPPGGPPCAPLGKNCGVEMHLPQLVDSIHAVRSDLIDPYLAHNRSEICAHCALLHSSICPCPMDYLAVLVVEAVEAVDRRHAEHDKGLQFLAGLPEEQKVEIEAICRAYEEGTGTWAGCDWPTQFGSSELNLNHCTAAEAESMAVDADDAVVAKGLSAAARWLTRVEELARQAEAHAAAAVKAASAGRWEEARQQAHLAWAGEFSTGRPLRKKETAWKKLLLAIKKAHHLHRNASITPAGKGDSSC